MKLISKFILVTLLLTTFSSKAGIIDVLWLSGNTNYNDYIATMAAGGANDAANYDPLLDGSNSWNIDFWANGAAAPDLTTYDALVIGSTCYGASLHSCSGSNGFFGLDIYADNILNNKAAIESARGSRTFVSGQDADWHMTRSNNMDAMAFLINAVNWAASGTGLGIVALADGHQISPGNGWINDNNSFLKDEIGGARLTGDSESVVIPTDSEDFPINEGLTSAKLSNWGVSSHTYFDKSLLDASKWKAINDYSVLDGPNAVTIVTASEASGSTDPNDIPEPQTLVLFALSLLLLSYRKIVK
ncbi:PEP-CTERM sorting domain-containing protein [Thalassotalea sp. M1531]|uniref:PEP-CTERM sorting domain-containing protein n=1 Tax=Thalassotalea algicola TaxID=2716224 RepID=A0A7Y0L928_9GAMM|nr:PEP-CTERM sorting domain-containing protein [Thalassotalea algicola]NMP30219.1 PEP-CTERM sorting domain-containing protein [Thalassotalea algicola]